jgi:hypothetical protein
MKHITLAIGVLASLMAAPAYPDSGEMRRVSGTVACGGAYFNRQGGTEAHRTSYTLRNVDAMTSINIDRIRVFDAIGETRFDSDSDGFPIFQNEVLSSADTVLDPHQSAQLNLDAMLASPMDDTHRPGIVEFAWSSAGGRVLVPSINLTRYVRDRNPETGAIGAERSRGSGRCRHISTVRW